MSKSTIKQANKSKNLLGFIGSEETPEANFRIGVADSGKGYVLSVGLETNKQLNLDEVSQKLNALVESLFEA